MSRKKPIGPIPHEVDLGAFLIRVRLISKREMMEETEHEDPTTNLPHGYWDPEEEMICIAKWISLTEQRWVLLHELGHAALDLRDFYDRRKK